MKGAGHSSGNSAQPGLLGEVPCSPFPSCLLFLILPPAPSRKHPEDFTCHSDHVSVGGRNGSTLLFGPERSTKYGQGRQVPRARSSLGLWWVFLLLLSYNPWQVGCGAHRHWGICIFVPVPLDAAASGRPAPTPLGYILLLRLYFNKKNLLTMQVGSCIPLLVS